MARDMELKKLENPLFSKDAQVDWSKTMVLDDTRVNQMQE
jgi:hypothetical protein